MRKEPKVTSGSKNTLFLKLLLSNKTTKDTIQRLRYAVQKISSLATLDAVSYNLPIRKIINKNRLPEFTTPMSIYYVTVPMEPVI